MGSHWPQSCGQIAQVSKSSQTLLGQTEQTPQSVWHEAQVSGDWHRPLPQSGQAPQSSGHWKQFSLFGLQTPLGHDSHWPQSGAQLKQS